MKSIIKAVNLSKSFGDHQALIDINFAIPKGQIFGLLGPNGAGKTTFIRILNQIYAPDQGEILFDGEPISKEHIQQIGYLPEERGLYKKMKVLPQLIFLAQLKGLSKKVAQEKASFWLEKLQIQDWANKPIEALSKGMAQKIQFISTVIHDPELIILDEPFSGFDPINIDLIKNEILEFKKEKKTILYSTHNMNSVEEICDHMAIIHKGQKLIHGKVDTIRSSRSEGVFEILFKGNMISFTNALWTGFDLIHHEEIEQYKFKALIKATTAQNINKLLEAVIPFCEIISVHEKTPSVNDIFIQEVNNTNLEVNG
jgi:ABC-2 type transport system ATP-binding protein